VADLIMHEKKYEEKLQKRNEAIKQKQDVANMVTTKAVEAGNFKKEESKRKEEERLNDYMNKVQTRKKQAAEAKKRIVEEKESAKERLVRVKQE